MLYTFRYEGKKYAYDSASGAVIRPDALQFKMLGAIQPPLTRSCPTSLRYELAKFDSMDVEETYDGIYKLFQAGILYAEDNGVIRVMCDGEYGFPSAGLIAAALTEAFADAPNEISFQATGNNSEDACRIAADTAARLGKNLK